MTVEVLAKLGIPLITAVDQHYEILKMIEEWRGHDPILDHSPEDCTKMYQDGWSEIPLLGSVSDIHHGSCYRMFNVSEEIIAHRYNLGSRPSLPANLSWTKTVEAARNAENSL